MSLESAGQHASLRRLTAPHDTHQGLSSVTINAPDARTTLLEWYRLDSAEHLRLMMVSTLDGRAAGSDGTSETLTSRIDRTILGVVRELSDLVLVGAETLRREPALIPRERPLAVLSTSGSLGTLALPSEPARDSTGNPVPRLTLVTTETGSQQAHRENPSARIIVLDETSPGRVSLAAAIASLRAQGAHRIVAEGGPSVAGALLQDDLVDELCLTVMPSVGGPQLALLGDATRRVTALTLTQLLTDESGALFGRWSVQR